MSDIDAAITSYQQKVEDVAKNCEGLVVLKALLTRDVISFELTQAGTVTAGQLARVAHADRVLKQHAQKINDVVGPDTLIDWREARQQPTETSGKAQRDEWWWALDARAAGIQWHTQALNYLLWVCIVVSLSFIVESLRRFLSGEVGVLGTVLQGLVALLVGSTLVEVARHVTTLRSGRTEGWKSRSLKRRTVFTAFLISIAFGMWFLLPQVVKYYSNRGVSERYEGQLSNPIGRFQRTVSLDPSDAIAHYSLARSYEVITEYDKAEAEYKSAIRWDDQLTFAYDGLAHLMIAQKKDYVGALRLLNTGLAALERQKGANEFQNEDDYKRIKVSLLKNRAWAYFALGYLTQAEDDLRDAIGLRPKSAAPQCLLGQVLEGKAKLENTTSKPDAKGIKEAYLNCVGFSYDQKDKIDADWLAHAQERLANEDEKESSADRQKNESTKQKKNP
jgi:tetratricopeptide (TPR) repeat protein